MSIDSRARGCGKGVTSSRQQRRLDPGQLQQMLGGATVQNGASPRIRHVAHPDATLSALATRIDTKQR